MKKIIIFSFMSFLLFGIARPVYTELIDRGGGLIYDTDRNITFLQDMNYAQTISYDGDGRMTWDEANQFIEYMNETIQFGYTNWRLPTALNEDGSGPVEGFYATGSEMGHLYYTELGNERRISGLEPEFEHRGPFINYTEDGYWYWSSTETAHDPSLSWYFAFYNGDQAHSGKELDNHVWPVRDGDVVPAIDAILEYFYNGVDEGTIIGRGRKSWLANLRLWLFGQMLESAKRHLEHGRTNRACKKLNSNERRCDGEPLPKDFIEGAAVPELSDMIFDLMEIECE
jgi:hypothetical protein